MGKIKVLILLGSLLLVGVVTTPLFFQKTTSDYKRVYRPVYYNFVILLDLSDRISPLKNPSQVRKDKQIILTVVNLFEKEVRKKFYLSARDNLNIVVAHQPESGYNDDLPTILNKLRIQLNSQTSIVTKPKFDEMKKELLANLNVLYEKAVANKRFVGADLWSFVSYRMGDYIVDGDKTYRNILIVLSDGYMDFDKNILATRIEQENRTSYMQVAKFRNLPNWEQKFDDGDYGLIPVKKDFGNLEVLVLEVNLRYPADKLILEKYWNNWLSEMGVRKAKLKMSGYAPDHIGEIIKKFLEAD